MLYRYCQPPTVCCSLQERGTVSGRIERQLDNRANDHCPHRICHSSWQKFRTPPSRRQYQLPGTAASVSYLSSPANKYLTTDSNQYRLPSRECESLGEAFPRSCKKHEINISPTAVGKLPRRVFRAPFIRRSSYVPSSTVTSRPHDQLCQWHTHRIPHDPSLPDWYMRLGPKGCSADEGEGCTCSTGASVMSCSNASYDWNVSTDCLVDNQYKWHVAGENYIFRVIICANNLFQVTPIHSTNYLSWILHS